MSDPPDETEYELVMPFVVCASAGGPYDDVAFVAGARFGMHQFQLMSSPNTQIWSDYVPPEMVPQYDLLAMHQGFVMKSDPWDWENHPDDWVLVTFTRAEATPDA